MYLTVELKWCLTEQKPQLFCFQSVLSNKIKLQEKATYFPQSRKSNMKPKVSTGMVCVSYQQLEDTLRSFFSQLEFVVKPRE